MCLVTAGCGLTNAVTGLAVAGLTGSSVVCISGQHPTTEDSIGSFQEAYGAEICETFSKWTKRVLDHRTIAHRPPTGDPRGDDDAAGRDRRSRSRRTSSTDRTRSPRSAAERIRSRATRCGRRAIRAASSARSSCSRARNVRCSSPATACSGPGPPDELRELAELTNTPVYARRAGQGSVPEDHPLAVRGAFKKPFTGRADVVDHRSASASGRASTSASRRRGRATRRTSRSIRRPTASAVTCKADVAIVGDPKLVLRQMIDAAKAMTVTSRGAWLDELAEARTNFEQMVAARADEHAQDVPIHPDRLMRDLVADDRRRRDGGRRQLHAVRLRVAPLQVALPGTAARRRPARARRSRRRDGDRRAARASGQAGRLRRSATAASASAASTWRRRRATSCRCAPCCGTTRPGGRASRRCRC